MEKRTKGEKAEAQTFTIVRKLGAGATSTVLLIKSALKHEKYAVKVYNKGSNARRDVEYSILSKLSHDNIIKVYDYGSASKYMHQSLSYLSALKMEFAPYGDLFSFLKGSHRFPTSIVRYIFKRIISVLEYLHEKKIYHLDIKLENVLIGENFQPKVADFSASTEKNFNDQPKGDINESEVFGTLRYLPPEVLEGKSYEEEDIDLFATGILMFCLYIGEFPFHRATREDCYYSYFAAGKSREYFEDYKKQMNCRLLGEDFKDLIKRMFAYEPCDRIKLKDIKQHPFYLGEEASQETYVKYMKDVYSELQRTNM